MKESAIQSKCLREVERLKRSGVPIKAYKAHSSMYTKAGTPDIHVTYRGKSYWIEMKRPGENPTKLQEHELEEWRKAGGVTGVATSLQEFLAILGIAHSEQS